MFHFNNKKVVDNLKKLLGFLSPLPSWLRVLIAALVTTVVSICVLMTACTVASSCGITQSVVNNIESDGNTIEMGVTPSTTTSTTVSPDIPINEPLKNSMWAVFVILTTSFLGDIKLTNRRIIVEADDEFDARQCVSNYLDAFVFKQQDALLSYEIPSITMLPPLFYCD